MDSLHRIYSEVPSTNCKGLCVDACGPVMGSVAEIERITERCGSFPLPVADGPPRCDKLGAGRCSIYADRPLVCRLYGATRKLRCEHGCSPDGGFMPERDARKLLLRAEKIKPADTAAARATREHVADVIRKRLEQPMPNLAELAAAIRIRSRTPHS